MASRPITTRTLRPRVVRRSSGTGGLISVRSGKNVVIIGSKTGGVISGGSTVRKSGGSGSVSGGSAPKKTYNIKKIQAEEKAEMEKLASGVEQAFKLGSKVTSTQALQTGRIIGAKKLTSKEIASVKSGISSGYTPGEAVLNVRGGGSNRVTDVVKSRLEAGLLEQRTGLRKETKEFEKAKTRFELTQKDLIKISSDYKKEVEAFNKKYSGKELTRSEYNKALAKQKELEKQFASIESRQKQVESTYTRALKEQSDVVKAREKFEKRSKEEIKNKDVREQVLKIANISNQPIIKPRKEKDSFVVGKPKGIKISKETPLSLAQKGLVGSAVGEARKDFVKEGNVIGEFASSIIAPATGFGQQLGILATGKGSSNYFVGGRAGRVMSAKETGEFLGSVPGALGTALTQPFKTTSSIVGEAVKRPFSFGGELIGAELLISGFGTTASIGKKIIVSGTKKSLSKVKSFIPKQKPVFKFKSFKNINAQKEFADIYYKNLYASRVQAKRLASRTPIEEQYALYFEKVLPKVSKKFNPQRPSILRGIEAQKKFELLFPESKALTRTSIKTKKALQLSPIEEQYALYFEKVLPKVSKKFNPQKPSILRGIEAERRLAKSLEPKFYKNVVKDLSEFYKKQSQSVKQIKLQKKLRAEYLKSLKSQSKKVIKKPDDFVLPKDSIIDDILKSQSKKIIKKPDDIGSLGIKNVSFNKGGTLTLTKPVTKTKTITKTLTKPVTKTKTLTKTLTKPVTKSLIITKRSLQAVVPALLLINPKITKTKTITTTKNTQTLFALPKLANLTKLDIAVGTKSLSKIKSASITKISSKLDAPVLTLSKFEPVTKIKQANIPKLISKIKQKNKRNRKKSVFESEKTPKKPRGTFHAFVRRNKNTKWVKVTNKPLPYNAAFNQGLKTADNTLARTVKLEPRGKNKIGFDDPFINNQKFRRRKTSSKIPGKEIQYVEKSRFALDTLGEKMGLKSGRKGGLKWGF